MKLIYKIAKAELRNLFYSPIAWFLTIAFMVQCAITYTKLINGMAIRQEMGGIGLNNLSDLTKAVFSSPRGLFSSIMQNLYLYMPLLTMGLVSREVNGGTISLLYSSPVKIREIIFGKYLAMMIYSLILVAVISIFLIAGIADIKSADIGMLISSTIGFYLLLCAYSAIGLFMSSLTSYQVVAAVSTFIMIGILSYIGTLWQNINFIRDLTYFLSLQGRTVHMLGGLITTKDVIYFIIIIYIFLGLSIYKLQSGRETKHWLINTGRYVAIIISALTVGYVSSIPNLIGYIDTTTNKDNTLTPTAQKIIKEMGNGKLKIISYANLLDDFYYLGLPFQRNIYLDRWERYVRFKPDIEFRYVNYYDVPLALSYNIFQSYPGKTIKQIAKQRAKGSDLDISMFETPEQIRKKIDLKPEGNRYVMELQYNGRSTFLRIFNDQQLWPGEAEVSAAFKRLLKADMPVIGFVTGNEERKIEKKGDREYKTVAIDKTFRFALINQGFNIDMLSLDTKDIPDNLKVLVIADPQTPLSATVLQKIQSYIAKGGNLLIAGEPGRQQNLNPLLQSLGVRLKNGMLVQQSEDYAPTLVLPHLTKAAIKLAKILEKPSIDTLPVSMNGVASLIYTNNYNGFQVEPLLVTKLGLVSNANKRNPDLDIVNISDSDLENSGANSHSAMMPVGSMHKISVENNRSLIQSDSTFTTAIALKRQINGKEQRIIISGDADFLSNSELVRNEPQVSNFYFSTALFSWLDYGQFPVDTSHPDAKDNRVTVTIEHVKFLSLLYIYIIPGTILIFAAVFVIRRRRK